MNPSRIKNVTAIVLAGGNSSRMKGSDKSMLPVRGVPMISHIVRQLELHFDEVIIGSGDVEKYKFLGHMVVADREKGCGPLMGIYSCLIASETDINFVTACDIPYINISLIRKMLDLSEGADIIVPVSGSDHYETLYAIYKKSVIPFAADLLSEGKFKISGLFEKVETRFIPFDPGTWYHNINYEEDYRNFNDDSFD